ncbi:MAG: hypothetical protein VX642_08380 [Bdellovibrionota bacterium]|nr:hypothetical protein [Bdellovibrionota bacterium]
MSDQNVDVSLMLKNLSAKWPEKHDSLQRLLFSLEGKLEDKLFWQFYESLEESVNSKNEFQFELSINLARRILQSQQELEPNPMKPMEKSSIHWLLFGTVILILCAAIVLFL